MSDRIRYVVRQFNWLAAGHGIFVRSPGERRIAWYDTAEDAEADRHAREQRVREKHNPFAFGPVMRYLTTFPVPIFRDWLLDADIEPPADADTDTVPWRKWWEATERSLSDSQRERVWTGLNRVTFHDVLARRDSDVAYAVVRIGWDHDEDGDFHAGHEGGDPLSVFGSRSKAEAEQRRLDAMDRDAARFDGYFPRDPELFLDYQISGRVYASCRKRPVDGPQFEVAEIDLIDSEPMVFLVVRVPLFGDNSGNEDHPTLRDVIPGCFGIERTVPVAAFATREAAQAEADRLDELAREMLNPVWLSGWTDFLPQGPDLVAHQPTPETQEMAPFRELPTNPADLLAEHCRTFDEQAGLWPPALRAEFWQMILGPVRLYAVTEITFHD